MTRTSHHSHPTPGFPVYCLDWANDETLLLGGGGGASRSGIDNKFQLCKVSKDGRSVRTAFELKLSSEEDSPMTVAVNRNGKHFVTGINASSSKVESGENRHCRLFSYANDQQVLWLAFVNGAQTIDPEWKGDFKLDYPYQKFTIISPSGFMVAVGTTENRVSILSMDTLETVYSPEGYPDELVDISWAGPEGRWLLVATVSAVYLYEILASDAFSVRRSHRLPAPEVDGSKTVIRAARLSPAPSTTPVVHLALNAGQSAKRGAPRKSWICTASIPVEEDGEEKVTEAGEVAKGKEKASSSSVARWEALTHREVAPKPTTVFDVSEDGRLLAFGNSDLSIGILDAKTLSPRVRILQAHSFPPTALKFNPSASLLVSASADNTIRVVHVPAHFGATFTPSLALILAILILILALYFRSR